MVPWNILCRGSSWVWKCTASKHEAFELDHDYLWRHEIACRREGEIAIPNGPMYENVLQKFTRNGSSMKIPGVEYVWKGRMVNLGAAVKQIRRFDGKNLRHGWWCMNFSERVKERTEKRFLERIEDLARMEILVVRLKGTRPLAWLSKAYEEAWADIHGTCPVVCNPATINGMPACHCFHHINNLIKGAVIRW